MELPYKFSSEPKVKLKFWRNCLELKNKFHKIVTAATLEL